MSTKMTRERAEEPWDRNTVGRRPDCPYGEVILMTGSEQIKPIEDVRGISAITYGFMASKALFAALDFDLFTHIARGIDTSPALAKATGIPLCDGAVRSSAGDDSYGAEVLLRECVPDPQI
jgi:hypothetical protein